MISLILGPMYSGKSTELLRRLHRAHIAKKRVVLIRPKVDFRDFLTHAPVEHSWLPIVQTEDVTTIDCSQYDVIGLDELQFFHFSPLFALNETRERNCHIIASGLQATSEGEMFPEVVRFIPYCDEIIKLNAVCVKCGSDYGTMTYYKIGKKTEQISVGGTNEYEARCLSCWRM